MTFDRNQAPVMIPAATLPTVLTVVYPRDCCVEYVAFMNRHTADVAVTVQDGNGIKMLSQITMPAGAYSPVDIPEGGLFFSKGISWSAASGALVDGWIRVRPV
jgi:hypothetical protein